MDPIDVMRIDLTGGRYALIDAADAESVGAQLWHARRADSGWYACRHMINTSGVRTRESMHKFITGWSLIDHRNGNGLDNRRCNLRPATWGQNSANQRKARRGSSQYKGVVYKPANGPDPWVAGITVNGRHRKIGRFAVEVEAALAYDAAARDGHGEFAAVNFPRPGERSAHERHPNLAEDFSFAPILPRPVIVVTECVNGHEFDEANTYVNRLGHRTCRKCRSQRERERQERLRASGTVRTAVCGDCRRVQPKASRGLCKGCHARHTRRGTLSDWPTSSTRVAA